MFEILFIIAIALYLVENFLFLLGAGKKFDRLPAEKLPTITVIVAARNEEENIVDCLEALNAIEYPEGKIEIIIADDRSTDATGRLIADYISDKPLFKTIQPSEPTETLKGKANAIDSAVKISNGEVILTTDADCMVSPDWAMTIASYFLPEVGFVGGYTSQIGGSLFNGMQMMDFVYLLTIAGSTINLGKPLSCIGNNMSYRRSAYMDTGGYGAIPFSVTEDFKLLVSIFKLKKYKLVYPLDPGGLVVSKPCPDIKTLYNQKKRWAVGGLDSDLTGFSVFGIGLFAHIMLLLLLIPKFFVLPLLILGLIKIFSDLFILVFILKKLKLKFNIIYFAVFELYFIIYVIMLPIVVMLSRKVSWKGRQF